MKIAFQVLSRCSNTECSGTAVSNRHILPDPDDYGDDD
jgi:hypothetical protein